MIREADIVEAARAELFRRTLLPLESDILTGSFPAQRAFVEDESSFQYAYTTRRAAKSYSAALKAVRSARRHRRCSVLILGLVRAEIKRIYWVPILKDIDERYAVGMRFHESDLTATLPNGSIIYLLGADANENEKRKILGQKFPLVIIDEAQDFITDLSELVFHVLKAAVSDYRGTICLLGTPGLVAKGLFFDVTTGKEPGWTRHEWTTFDNPYNAKQWGEEIAALKLQKPGVEKSGWFRRNFLREWVVEEDALVYRYRADKNRISRAAWEALLADPRYRDSWHFVLGVDLGYEDATSFTVDAYSDHLPALVTVESTKETGLDITATATRIKALEKRYDFEAMVVDGANKQAVEEMKHRHGLALIAADKIGKMDFIEIMNAELLAGLILLVEGACSQLEEEYATLVKDPKSDIPKEHPACPNHCADGGLYAWRHCYTYMHRPVVEAAAPQSPEWMVEQENDMREAFQRKLRGPDEIQPLGGEGWDSW